MKNKKNKLRNYALAALFLFGSPRAASAKNEILIREKNSKSFITIENILPYQLQKLEDKVNIKENPQYKIALLERKKPRIVRVSASEMSNAAGAYDTISDTIIERNDIFYKNADFAAFVNAHEEAHAQGIINEYKADCYAAYKTGKPEYIRGPFYRQPLNLN